MYRNATCSFHFMSVRRLPRATHDVHDVVIIKNSHPTIHVFFMVKQPFFPVDATPVSAQIAVFSNDPVTGNNKRQLITPVRIGNGARGGGLAQHNGLIFITARLPAGNSEKPLPHTLLKWGTPHMNGRFKMC